MAWQDFLTGLGQVGTGAAPLLGTGAQLYGQQNAAEAVNKANTAAAGTQADYLTKAGQYYQPYTSAGSAAVGALSRAEGLNGAAPDYSGFENMPGYKFAIEQGTQALQRQAAASGQAYNPQTGAAIGQYVTGTAMQDYNTYISQLQATAGMGETAANQIGNITYNTGANIAQLEANTGQSQAGMYTGMGQTLGGALGGYTPGYGGAGGYGQPGASGVGSLVSGVGNIASGIRSMWGGGTNPDGTPAGSSSTTDQYGNVIVGNSGYYTPPSDGGGGVSSMYDSSSASWAPGSAGGGGADLSSLYDPSSASWAPA